jgi:hypothetical protein
MEKKYFYFTNLDIFKKYIFIFVNETLKRKSKFIKSICSGEKKIKVRLLICKENNKKFTSFRFGILFF